MNYISFFCLLPFALQIYSQPVMWRTEFNDFQLNLPIGNMDLMESNSLIEERNFLTASINLDQDGEDQLLPISDYNDQAPSENVHQEPSQDPLLASTSRSEWSPYQEVIFFNFLGHYMKKHSQQFNSWKKPNKKGIFSEMKKMFASKNQVQCRLKYYSYKRKHSSKKNRYYYQPCMKAVIMEKLNQYAQTNEESRQILEKLKDMETKAQIVESHNRQNQKQRKATISLYQMMLSQEQRDSTQQEKKTNQEQIKKKKSTKLRLFKCKI